MSLIATSIEPQRITRIFLDCRDVRPDPAVLLRIERAIGDSAALAISTEGAPRQPEAIGGLTVPARGLEVPSRPNEPAWLWRSFMLRAGETMLSNDWNVVCTQRGRHPPPAVAQMDRED